MARGHTREKRQTWMERVMDAGAKLEQNQPQSIEDLPPMEEGTWWWDVCHAGVPGKWFFTAVPGPAQDSRIYDRPVYALTEKRAIAKGFEAFEKWLSANAF